MTGAKNNILEAVGGTPIVKLQKLARHVPADIFVKCEYLNPGGSMKDRVARNIVTDAERRGQLGPGGTIVEATSGNTGMGLALVAALRGYACVFVMPDKMSPEKMARPARVRRARRHLPDRRRARRPAQLLPDRQAHRRRDAERVLREPVPQPGQPRRALHLDGARDLGADQRRGRRLRGRDGDRRHDLGVRAASSRRRSRASGWWASIRSARSTTSTSRPGRMTRPFAYYVEGIGEDFLPSTMNLKMVDEIVRVDDKECFLMTRELVRQEGLFVGGSSGAAVAGAIKYAEATQAQGEHPGASPRRGLQVPVEDLRRQVDARERLPRRARPDGDRRRAPAPQEAAAAHRRQEGRIGAQRDRRHARQRRLADAGAGGRRGPASAASSPRSTCWTSWSRGTAGSTRRSIRWSNRTTRR